MHVGKGTGSNWGKGFVEHVAFNQIFWKDVQQLIRQRKQEVAANREDQKSVLDEIGLLEGSAEEQDAGRVWSQGPCLKAILVFP